MKKLFIIAAAALAFAACSKSEYNAPAISAINFAPNALSTKALILPDGNSPEQLAFPTTETFNVFAFADLGDGNGTNYTNPLMDDVNISNQGGDWKATTGTYLWPATGTVDFYAYHPASLNATFVSTDEPKGINIAGIELGTIIGSQIDPLVATVLAQSAPAKPKVALVFKHIASQIAVTAFDATTTETLKGKISIEKVTFKNLHTSGDYTKSTTIGKGAWSNINTIADFVSFQGSEVLQETESYLSGASFTASIDNSAAFVVIPDNVVTGTAADQIIEVQYSIAAYTINGFDYPATPTQTVNIPLYNRVSANKFQNGKRYVFHLGISLDGANNEIMFSPMVEGWETEDISGITIDAVNATLL
jgi:hypothetical protein